ncbi:MAG TPA: M20/M25/M40 family metallo-hydrolase, partial [Spirochaetota bacterium]|nr:M20/M25/M40 family metallo-hydrolase [Spirochaetota bacterium]
MLKKIGAIAGLVIMTILAIALIRTALFSSKQVDVKAIPKIDINVKGAAERFAGALRFKTVSHIDPAQVDYREFTDFYAYLDKAFPLVKKHLTKELVNRYSILYTWKGSDPKAKPILLMGHSDVVPVEPGTEKDWKYPPFAGKIAEGCVWGRGAQDIKLNVTGVLEAFEYLLKKGYKPKRTIYMAIGHTEEVRGQEGNGRIADLLKSRG